jgi:asparagine synthase (glutamine-hydrolysing)
LLLTVTDSGALLWSAAARRRFLSLPFRDAATTCANKEKKKESGVEPPHSKAVPTIRDSQDFWSAFMNAGFEVVLDEQGLSRLAVFPREPVNPLVTWAVDRERGCVCLALGKVYYRDDLARRLGLEPAARWQEADEAELILAAYNRHGPDALAQLEGDVATVVWDQRRQALYAWRDLLGAWPLHWGRHRGQLLISTSLLRLAAVTGQTQVDPDYLGRFLMYPYAGLDLGAESTALAAFRRVQPGTLVRFQGLHEPQELARWTWERFLPAPGGATPTLTEAAGQFRDVFSEAVAQRLERGRLAAHLSGGKDSTAIVCLADRWLRRYRPHERLTALSVVFATDDLAGETEFIRQALDQHPDVRPQFLAGEGLEYFAWFDEPLPAHDEPFQGLFQVKMMTALADGAARAGAQLVVGGTGAESVADGSRAYLADWLRRGRLWSAWAEAVRWARASNESPWSYLAREGLALLVPPQWRGGCSLWWRRGQAQWPDCPELAVPPWVRPDFARRHRLWETALAEQRRMCHAPYEAASNLFNVTGAAGEWADRFLAGPRGVQGSRPFLDPRVVAFCLGLPRECRVQPGVAKPLLVEAMRGVLPESIRTRRWWPTFNRVFLRGLTRHLPLLQDMIARSPLRELGVLDHPRLVTMLHQLAAGVGSVDASGRMNATLGLIAWHDHLPGAVRAWAGVEALDVTVLPLAA